MKEDDTGTGEPTTSPSWADIMSDSERLLDETPNEDEDMCDHLLRFFPVPGEIWVHLRSGQGQSGDDGS